MSLNTEYTSREEYKLTENDKIGLALRMAISLGLHQEVSDPDITEIERDRRRRAWWSVYSLDRYLLKKVVEEFELS